MLIRQFDNMLMAQTRILSNEHCVASLTCLGDGLSEFVTTAIGVK